MTSHSLTCQQMAMKRSTWENSRKTFHRQRWVISGKNLERGDAMHFRVIAASILKHTLNGAFHFFLSLAFLLDLLFTNDKKIFPIWKWKTNTSNKISIWTMWISLWNAVSQHRRQYILVFEFQFVTYWLFSK